MRRFSNHTRWTNIEVDFLIEHFHSAPWAKLFEHLPGRTRSMIQCKANLLGIRRLVPPKMSPEERLFRKRESMARRRRDNPEAAREYHRKFHRDNRERQISKMRNYYARRFFWGRATKLRGKDRATYRDLASIWKRQRGACALTGRRLDRMAEVDHILPKARGGGDEAVNLRWACRQVNLAKRDLTDIEFNELCGDVMRYIGERIALVDSVCNPGEGR